MSVSIPSNIIGLPPNPADLPKHEKVAWAKKLRALKMSPEFIGELLGVHRKTVWSWTKEESPADATGEANDQPCDETTNQDDRTGSDSTSVAMTTSGDKAS